MSNGILEWLVIDSNTKRRRNHRSHRGFEGSRRPHLESLEDRRMLATMWVSVDWDGTVNPGDGNLTLREAITYVNEQFTPPPDPGDLKHFETDAQGNLKEPFGTNDTILFSDGTNGRPNLNGLTINLLQSGLEITKSVKIDASDLSLGITIDMSDEASGQGAITHASAVNSVSIELVGLTFSGITNLSAVYIGSEDGINSSFIIRDCKIKDNQMLQQGSPSFYGQGIQAGLDGGDSLLIENTSIHNNTIGDENITAYGAGGISVVAEGSANVEIVGCDISDNNVTGNCVYSTAGGIDFYFYNFDGNIRIAESVIENNHTDGIGGGIRFYEDTNGWFKGTLSIEDSRIANNSASSDGGGIYVSLDGGKITLTNSTIEANIAGDKKINESQGTGFGGGIYLNYLYDVNSSKRSVLIDSNLISGNKSNQDGGGIYIESTKDEIKIINSTISENECEGSGRGVYADVLDDGDVGNVLIAHSTIVQNKVGVDVDQDGAQNRTSRGGGLYTKWNDNEERNYADAVLYHTIVADNRDYDDWGDDEWGEDKNESRSVPNIFIDGPSTPGSESEYSDSDSIVADYCFLDCYLGSFDHLSPISAFKLYDYDGDHYYDDLDIGPGGIIALNASYTIVDNENNYDPERIVDPVLRDNGGPTLTHKLLVPDQGKENPAIDGGDPDAVAGGTAAGYLDGSSTTPHKIPFFDQRGISFDRVYDGDDDVYHTDIIDMGAYEHQPVRLRIIDVVIDGTDWARDPYVYREIVPEGDQLRPIPTDGADTIEIHFNGSNNVQYNHLRLAQTIRIPGGGASNADLTASTFSYNELTKVASWVFLDGQSNSQLVAGKYAIHLDNVASTWHEAWSGRLDGDWENKDNGTPDDFDDDPEQELISGNGVETGEFRFHFSILPGDSNQDGIVEAER